MPGERASLAEILAKNGWKRAVVKPIISGGAYRTTSVSEWEAEAQQRTLDYLAAETGALVQPFMEEVAAEGEWSLFFFGGRFSHAILKVPKAGDFRVQPQFGGVPTRCKPDAALLAQAQKALEAVPELPAYARVDGIRRGADFLLMEMEIIEPYLFLAQAPDCFEAYLDAVLGDLTSTG